MNQRVPAEAYARVAARDPESLVRTHAPLVKRIACHLQARLPDSVQLDDLLQAGMLGLLEAARKFEEGHGASFETYAGFRIRGAMLDDLRRGDWAPRSVHRNARRIGTAIATVERALGRTAHDTEVAAELGLPVEEYRELLSDAASCRLFSLDEMESDDDGGSGPVIASSTPSPLRGLFDERFADDLAAAIADLPEREKLALSLYYDEELNLKEIGLVLGVSESRISQMLSKAALRLREALADWRRDDAG